MRLSSGTRLGNYEVLSMIGKGGMGEVYRASDIRLKRDVALKVLPEEFSRDNERISRFQREAEMVAALNHPNIAAIHEMAEFGSTTCLVLEFVPGDTLADIIRSRGSMPVEEVVPIALQICDALEAAHEKGVIHRDLKPANIKITADGKLKLLDFGLARIFEEEASANLSKSP